MLHLPNFFNISFLFIVTESITVFKFKLLQKSSCYLSVRFDSQQTTGLLWPVFEPFHCRTLSLPTSLLTQPPEHGMEPITLTISNRFFSGRIGYYLRSVGSQIDFLCESCVSQVALSYSIF